MNPPEILYHYCSTQGFHSIIESGRLRLSSVKHSNDYMEGRLVLEALKTLITNGKFEGKRAKLLESRALQQIEDYDGLALCLSEDGDLLSQWRGYSEDATGVAIGFFSQSLTERLNLENLSESRKQPRLRQVKYTLSDHLKEVQPVYALIERYLNHMEDLEKAQAREVKARPVSGMEGEIQRLAPVEDPLKGIDAALQFSMFTLKSLAFVEEKEWRLISVIPSKCRPELSYRVRGCQIVPYLDYALRDKTVSVRRVILGPKHPTPVPVVKAFLESAGYGDVDVVPSKASYVSPGTRRIEH